jgi:hypothetical protein
MVASIVIHASMSYVCGAAEGLCPCCVPEDEEELLEELDDVLVDGTAGFTGEPHPTRHTRSTRRTEYFIYSLR